jgi:hypothetical protein
LWGRESGGSDLGVEELLPVGPDEVEDAGAGPLERHRSHQQAEQNDEREDGEEIGRLPRALHPLGADAEGDGPRAQQTEGQLPVGVADPVLDVSLLPQHLQPEPGLGRADRVVQLGDVVGLGGDAGQVLDPAAVAPRGVALRPRQIRRERVDQVVEGERHERAVVGGDGERPDQLAEAHPLEYRGDALEHLHVASAAELAQAHLQIVHGAAEQDQHGDVWDEEGAAPVLVGDEREPPDVAEADVHRDAAHEELDAVAPFASVFDRVLFRHYLEGLWFGTYGVLFTKRPKLHAYSRFDAFPSVTEDFYWGTL